MGGTFDPFKEMRTNITTENGRLKDKLAALEIKYSEAVGFITGLSEPEQCPDSCKCESYDTRAATDDKIFCEQRSICLDCISEKAKDLLKRHKEEV